MFGEVGLGLVHIRGFGVVPGNIMKGMDKSLVGHTPTSQTTQGGQFRVHTHPRFFGTRAAERGELQTTGRRSVLLIGQRKSETILNIILGHRTISGAEVVVERSGI